MLRWQFFLYLNNSKCVFNILYQSLFYIFLCFCLQNYGLNSIISCSKYLPSSDRWVLKLMFPFYVSNLFLLKMYLLLTIINTALYIFIILPWLDTKIQNRRLSVNYTFPRRQVFSLLPWQQNDKDCFNFIKTSVHISELD